MRLTRRDAVFNVSVLIGSAVGGAAILRRAKAQRLATEASAAIPAVVVGEALLDLPSGAYSRAPYTLVMYVASTCAYCTASMPFYRALLRGRPETQALAIVAAAPEPPKDTRTYLAKHGVEVDEVFSVGAGMPTPTLVLVDSTGTVKHTWIGRLAIRGEVDVLSKIQGVTRS